MKGKEFLRVVVHRTRPRSGDTRELAAQLAPLEELTKSGEASQTQASQVVAQEDGAIVVGSEQTELAKEVVEAEEGNGGFTLEPVVVVIVVLMLVFIVFIAWQISQLPAEHVSK